MPKRTEIDFKSKEEIERYREDVVRNKGKISILIWDKKKEKYIRVADPVFHSNDGVKVRMFKLRLGNTGIYDMKKTRFQRLKGIEGSKLVFEDIEGDELEALRKL